MLFNQRQLWAASSARYGTYEPGYKKDLATIWQKFFETSEPGAVDQLLDEKAYEEHVKASAH